jgi:Xaa-Pro aminopeptidase
MNGRDVLPVVPRSVSRLVRLVNVRERMRAAAVDALVVSHLPNVRYLTGFVGTAGLVVLTPTTCDLIVDFRYQTVARALLASTPEAAPFKVVVPLQSYDETLAEVLRDCGARRIGIEAAYMPVNRFNRLAAALAGSAPTPLRSADACPALVPTERIIESERVVKDEGEIRTLREAARRLGLAAPEATALARVGRSELDVAADIDAVLRRHGFERPAFETIVASGPNSALPHARPSDRRLEDGDGVVLDFGGVYDGYCVDLTRTVELGDAGAEFRRLFAAVAEAQRAAIDAVRPGVKASAVDYAARSVLSRYGLGDAFGHGTGHGLGLEVHEEPKVGRLLAGHPDWVLQPGMVFTIEPGAYVEGIGGVRIEDDVLVTDEGRLVLTANGG